MKITPPRVLSAKTEGKTETPTPVIVKINFLSPVNLLESILIGDQVMDEHGKNGEVMDIEIIRYRRETHYYFKLKQRGGTILIIR